MSTPTEPGPFDDRSDQPARPNRAGGSHEQVPTPGSSRGSSPLEELFSSEPAYEPEPSYDAGPSYPSEPDYQPEPPTGAAYDYPPPPSYDPAAYGAPPSSASYDSPDTYAPRVPYDPPTPPIPYEPPAPRASYDPPASYDPRASYDPSASSAPPASSATSASPGLYDTPPSYDLPPSYDSAAYNGAPTYEAPPASAAPPAPAVPSGYDNAPGYEPAYSAPSYDGTATPDGPPTQAQPAAEAESQPQFVPEPEFTYEGAPDDGRAPRVSIVLPCYNEQDHVLLELERISRAMDASGMPYELIAVDDCSTDATLARLQLAEPKLPRLKVVHFPRNGGAGTVRRIGSQQAKGDIVVWTDADMTYPNERIPELVAILEENPLVDQVVGARTTEEGTYKFLRVPAKFLIRKLAEGLTNSKIPDLNSGLRAFRREIALPYLRLLPPGFSCVTTITLAFLSNEHVVQYVPIDYAKRAGVSKFRFVHDAYRYILQVLRMVMYFNPLKVLMPVALFLLGLGIAKGIYDQFAHPLYFAINTVLIFVTGLIIASLALLADLIVRSRGDT